MDSTSAKLSCLKQTQAKISAVACLARQMLDVLSTQLEKEGVFWSGGPHRIAIAKHNFYNCSQQPGGNFTEPYRIRVHTERRTKYSPFY